MPETRAPHFWGVAPINIAIIKYMGKSDEPTNTAGNLSLSYTSPRFLTRVVLSPSPQAKDILDCRNETGEPFQLSHEGEHKVLKFVSWLKEKMHIEGHVNINSRNEFPLGCGLASSASSFAAITQAMARLAYHQHEEVFDWLQLAHWSRQGSGSSCRSFFAPWALWRGDRMGSCDMNWTSLLHHVIVVEGAVKSVSSSEAHRRVVTSPHYSGRASRVLQRYQELLQASNAKDWHACRTVIDEEWRDMHNLFATCDQPFRYVTPATERVLAWLDERWQEEGDGPWVTLDAGANVHLLFRHDCHDMAKRYLNHWQQYHRTI